MRIGFLFNRYAGHQVLHAVPIAFELSRRYPQASIKIIGSDRHVLDVVQKLSVLYPGERCKCVLAHVPACVAMVDRLEPAGHVDSWPCVGDEPCIVQITMSGRLTCPRANDELLDYRYAKSARILPRLVRRKRL